MSEVTPTRSGRASWLFNAGVLVFALTAIALLAVIVTARAGTRLDMTSTRQHALAPRSAAVLSKLDRPLTLAVAADFASLPPNVKQRTFDVLEQFEHASKQLTVRTIDTSSQSGLEQYDALLKQLTVRDKPRIDASVEGITALAARAEQLAEGVRQYQTKLQTLAQQPGANKGYLDAQAAKLRVLADDTTKAAASARTLIAPAEATLVPPIDKARADLGKPINDVALELTNLARLAEGVRAKPDATEQEKALASAIFDGLPGLRDASGLLAADVAKLELPRLLRVARAMQSRRAALLIDEANLSKDGIGLVAIDADALFSGGEGVDLRARCEDMITGAVATLTGGARPTVCIVHGAPMRLAQQDYPLMRVVRERLSMRGIDLIEWPVALERDMPAVAAANNPTRPIVFVTITAEGKAQDRASSIAAFAGAINQIVASGRSVLLSVNLSQTPMNGAQDPLTEALLPLGVNVDSGRVLLQQAQIGTRRVVSPFVDVVDPRATHAVSGAAFGLTTRLPWCVQIDAGKPAQGVTVQPVIVLESTSDRWAESEWTEFNRGVSTSKGEYTLIANPPMKDTSRDDPGTSVGWLLAAAVERSTSAVPRQRIVVVGSNGWFLDTFTNQQDVVDGQAVSVYPGNAALFEAAVQWLAFQDDQILRGATVSRSAVIKPMSPGSLAWLRVLLIAGLPVGVLLLGVLYRAWRG